MAGCYAIICSACQFTVEVWDDGNPYFINDDGSKQYAYHPNHDALMKCVGNDVPHICLTCAHPFMVDSRAPINACPSCTSSEIVDKWDLGGHSCPQCHDGTMQKVPEIRAIS